MKKLLVTCFAVVVSVASCFATVSSEELARIHGNIKIVPYGQCYDYAVVVDETCPDLDVQCVEASSWADAPGLWYLTDFSEDFRICIVEKDECVPDFAIRFVTYSPGVRR